MNNELPLTNRNVISGGGVTSAWGFSACGLHVGFRKNPARPDMALVVADEPAAAAATFTTNRFCAAPVQVSRAQLGGAERCYGTAQAVVINSGNANAATGEPGLETARATCRIVSETVGCAPSEVLVASTGVIGQQLGLECFETGVPAAYQALSREGGKGAACAIMTTDTHPKECAVEWESADPAFAGKKFIVGGMCKGSGMIMPNMATMIAVITTDAPVEPSALRAALSAAVSATFNKVTVDSDTSTNDTCFMLASGAAAKEAEPIREGTPAFEELAAATRSVCENLARQIAGDGEGSTRLVTVTVKGAASDEEADALARSVANSPLVKTAIAGHDCNWGRIAAALGKCGVPFDQTKVDIDIMDLPVCRAGLTVPFDEDEALRRFERTEITIVADLHAGDAETTVWTCDLTHGYISINADYRS